MWLDTWDKKVALVARRFDNEVAAHVALLLVGARPAWVVDWSSKRDASARATTVHRKEIVSVLLHEFEGVLDAVASQEPLVFRVGAVAERDLAEIRGSQNDRKRRTSRAYARALNFAGTAYPCNKHKDVFLVEWTLLCPKGRSLALSQHCAKPSELEKCWRDFSAMRERARPIIGRRFGSLIISALLFQCYEFPHQQLGERAHH